MSATTSIEIQRVGQKRLTADEFFDLPEPVNGCKQELVRGEVIEMALPGFQHGVCVGQILTTLNIFLRQNRIGRATSETGIVTERGPDTVRGPDVAYWSAERLPFDQSPVRYADLPADLVVEVLSPSNRPGQMREKVREYFVAGVRIVWLMDPVDRLCVVHTSATESQAIYEKGFVTGGDVLPGFSCQVADFFAA